MYKTALFAGARFVQSYPTLVPVAKAKRTFKVAATR